MSNHNEEEEYESYDEEEDKDTSIEGTIYTNICQEMVSIIFGTAVSDAYSAQKFPQKHLCRLETIHPEMESELETKFASLQEYMGKQSKEFKEIIKQTYTIIFDYLQSCDTKKQ